MWRFKMSLLQQIQEAVVNEKSDLGSVLLKLRLLAAKLGSDILEEWVKHESEGYPHEIDVPSYRVADVSYRGTFSGVLGSGVKNAPIPSYLIKKYAGDRWIKHEVRDSIAAVEEMVKEIKDGKTMGLNAADLILALQGKIYEEYSCNEIVASFSPTSFYEIKQTVRNRILELTIELEKSVPGAINVEFGSSAPNKKETERVQQISQQIIYGDVHNAVAGSGHVSVAITERDSESFVKYLVESGILKSDASELAKIMETENPSTDDSFGKKAQKWIGDNIKKAADETWNIGVSEAFKVLTKAAIKFYGL